MEFKEDIITPAKKVPRAGWEACFKEMRRRGEDALLVPDCIDPDFKDWEWRSDRRRSE